MKDVTGVKPYPVQRGKEQTELANRKIQSRPRHYPLTLLKAFKYHSYNT